MHAPWRESGDPYEALVAAVMAQQTQMSRVMPSYERFVAVFPTLEALADAALGDVIRVWKGMGYNQRAVRLHRAARTIAEHGWPHDAASLAKIDGIGPFTAAIIASFAFNEPAACVDTNVVRVLTRLAGDDTLRGRRLQGLADACMTGAAARQPARWNQALMDYGARVCAIRPKCDACVINKWCDSRDRFVTPGVELRDPARLPLVADSRTPYAISSLKPPTTKPQRPTTNFEHTPRYFRGRIIDTLRDLPRGETISMAILRKRVANEITPDAADVEVWVAALERSGRIHRSGDRLRLPV
jgi:A/G-specific adenine glycosylase